jgi:hypothetical protein
VGVTRFGDNVPVIVVLVGLGREVGVEVSIEGGDAGAFPRAMGSTVGRIGGFFGSLRSWSQRWRVKSRRRIEGTVGRGGRRRAGRDAVVVDGRGRSVGGGVTEMGRVVFGLERFEEDGIDGRPEDGIVKLQRSIFFLHPDRHGLQRRWFMDPFSL